ncbi:hypothetical protein HDU86_001846 [Geranomyces michiganensis]|nr:hypothetical protein HDU86_001846 [Geranomyces michiganensis]
MLKSDLIRIIANLAYEAPEVQDAFRHIGGLHAVLNHCAIDDDNPYIKEHSILALRNLLDSNPANQRLVEQLRPSGIERESNELLAQMGKVASVGADGRVVVAPARGEANQRGADNDDEAMMVLDEKTSRVQFMEVDL